MLRSAYSLLYFTPTISSRMSKKGSSESKSDSQTTKKESSLFEEDDEFEEFPSEGIILINCDVVASSYLLVDWDESGEDSTDKQLWEDNWDDDNVEDEFSCQLR